MNPKDFLYWHMDTTDIAKELEWAIHRFNVKFDKPPQVIYINPKSEQLFLTLNLTLKVQPDKSISERYFGLN